MYKHGLSRDQDFAR